MTEGKRNIIHQLLEEYDIETAEDIQEALKDLLGGTIKEMMEAEYCKLLVLSGIGNDNNNLTRARSLVFPNCSFNNIIAHRFNFEI